MNYLEIYNISKKCRKRLEKYAYDFDFPDNLEELCAIASATLFTELSNKNIKCKIVANSFHCFIMVKDRIIDITATQFGIQYPKILIKKKDILNKELWWNEKKYFTSINSLYNWQWVNEWPSTQLAKNIKENNYGRV